MSDAQNPAELLLDLPAGSCALHFCNEVGKVYRYTLPGNHLPATRYLVLFTDGSDQQIHTTDLQLAMDTLMHAALDG